MSTKRMMALAMATLFTLTLAAEVMAAGRTQSHSQTRTPTTTCTPKLDGSGRR